MLDNVTPPLMPPTRSTLPSVNSVAVWPDRSVDRACPEAKLSPDGLNSSVVPPETHDEVHESYPPAKRTSPFVNIVAV